MWESLLQTTKLCIELYACFNELTNHVKATFHYMTIPPATFYFNSEPIKGRSAGNMELMYAFICSFAWILSLTASSTTAEKALWLVRYDKKDKKFDINENALSNLAILPNPVKVISKASMGLTISVICTS